jgi:uroporphyrinogen III methyltransferase / synthase
VKVVLTRAEGGSPRLAAKLETAGLEVVECPLIRIDPIDGPPIRAGAYDWLVVTSARAVDLLFERLEGPVPRVAAIGPGTAAALRARGVEPELVPAVSHQGGLVAELAPRLGESARVLFAGAADARDVLVRELGADVVHLYRTVPIAPARFPDGDLVVLASASAARSFAALGLDLPCVSIGPVTSVAAREAGLTVVAEAETHDLDGLTRAVIVAASHVRSSPS